MLLEYYFDISQEAFDELYGLIKHLSGTNSKIPEVENGKEPTKKGQKESNMLHDDESILSPGAQRQ